MSITPSIIDVVIPICNEEENLPELCQRLDAIADGMEDKLRVIFVNDGSKDRSALLIGESIAKLPDRYAHVKLSRNFGHQAAVTAGLHSSTGDAVVIMDGDLQDPPELIRDMIVEWKKGAHVVVAQRTARKESGLRRIGFELFHRFFNSFSDLQTVPNTGVFGLLGGAVRDKLNTFEEHHRFFPGLRTYLGYDVSYVLYNREERAHGTPKQSMKRLVRYALDGVFSFSYKPLRWMTYLGMLFSLVGFALATLFIVKRLMGVEIAQTGFTTMVTLILVIGGFQLIAIGLLGEYIGRIYDEVKNRPLFIVQSKSGFVAKTQ